MKVFGFREQLFLDLWICLFIFQTHSIKNFHFKLIIAFMFDKQLSS
jgi:hypothetical protein